jgi:hypothetical protein
MLTVVPLYEWELVVEKRGSIVERGSMIMCLHVNTLNFPGMWCVPLQYMPEACSLSPANTPTALSLQEIRERTLKPCRTHRETEAEWQPFFDVTPYFKCQMQVWTCVINTSLVRCRRVLDCCWIIMFVSYSSYWVAFFHRRHWENPVKII